MKRVTKKGRAAVSRKIRKFRAEGLSPKQAVGAAFGHLRRKKK